MRTVTMSRLTDDVLALYAPSMRTCATFRMMSQILTELASVPGVKRSSDLTPTAIARWIELHPGRSPARTEALLRCVRVVCNFAVASGWLRSSPFDFRALKLWVRADAGAARPSAHRHKSAADITRILRHVNALAAGGAWADGRLQALVYVYAYTAFRRDEALHILAANVDFRRDTIRLEPVDRWRPKTVRSARELPMAPPLRDVLKLWAPRCGSRWLFPGRRLRTPWSGGPGYKPIDQIRAAAKDAGVDGMTIIGFRKSFGTWAKVMGLSPLEVQAILGHSNVFTQAHYDEEAIESLRPAMARVAAFYGQTGT